MTTIAESSHLEEMARKLSKLVAAKKRIDEGDIQVLTVQFKNKERNESAYIEQSVFGELAGIKQVLSSDLAQRIESIKAKMLAALTPAAE